MSKGLESHISLPPGFALSGLTVLSFPADSVYSCSLVSEAIVIDFAASCQPNTKF